MTKGWHIAKLGDVCEFEGGSQPPKSQFAYEPRPGYVRFLQIRDFGSDKNITYIPESKKNRLCKNDDILIGRYGASVGKILTDKAGAYNVALMKTIPNMALLDRNWFYHFLNSDLFQTPLLNVADRSAQAGFSKDDIFNFPVPIPPLVEQQRIVEILDEAFEDIATTKANAEKNLQNARALFESHLQSVFTQRGEGWVETRLADICDRVSVGHVGPTSEFYCDPSDGIPFLRSQNVRPGKLAWDGVQYITKEFHGRLRKSQIRFGDLLFVRVGANRGDCCAVLEDVSELNCANIVFARPTKGNAAYLERYCQSPVGRAQLLGMTTGSAQGVINTSSVAELVVPLPSESIQQEIVERIDELHEETQRLATIYERKLAALDELKKSLLHHAFSGQL